MRWEKLIDKKLERQVIVFLAEEGNNSLYELIQELNFCKELNNRDKFDAARHLLRELINEGLVWIEKYLDKNNQIAIEPIDNETFLSRIDDVRHWQLDSKPAYVLKITDKGTAFLNNASRVEKDSLTKRLYNSEFRF